MEHKNIVKFVGILVTHEGKIHLVTELMDFDLKSVMTKLHFDEKLRIAKDISNAMYVHPLATSHLLRQQEVSPQS